MPRKRVYWRGSEWDCRLAEDDREEGFAGNSPLCTVMQGMVGILLHCLFHEIEISGYPSALEGDE
jgi:hypothetical protein